MLIAWRWLGHGLRAGLLGLAVLGCSSDPSGDPGAHTSAMQNICALPVGTSPTLGPDNAPVTILEFVDFQCPFCAAAEPIRKQVDVERPSFVRWVFKHLPLAGHVRALPAAIAAECANEQDQFWPMNDLLFANQGAAEDTDFAEYASQLGLDMALWRDCLQSDRPRQRIAADIQQVEQAKLGTTPSYLINGKRYPGLQQRQNLLDAIDRARSEFEASGVPAAQYYELLESQGCQ